MKAKESPLYDPALRAEEAAAYVGLASKTLLAKARMGEIARVQEAQAKGSPVRFRLSALNAWLRKHELPVARYA